MSRRSAQRRHLVERFQRRSMAIMVMFMVAAVVVVGASGYYQVLDSESLNREGDQRHLRRAKVAAHRGAITDRNGVPLAISAPVDSVWAMPSTLAPEVDAFPQLAAALDTDPQQLLRVVNRNMSKEFVWLKRHLTPGRVAAVSELALPGISVRREYRRYYPAGEVAGHLVGFTDIDDVGQESLELAFNHALAGEAGAKRVLRDRLGRVIEEVESIRPARQGSTLTTSIDLRLQYIAYRELKAAMQRHRAESGSIVILDVRTGEVLAMVNQPSYNPNDRSQYSPDRYRNRAITDLLEPGSSMKPLTMAIALEAGAIHEGSVIDTSPGRIEVGAKLIEDHHSLGPIDLATLIARSSNVGIVKVALGLQAERFWQGLSAFGFGTLTQSGFPGESAGLLSHYSDWREISQATIAYGYGLSVTPLQLARAYAALGNEGMLLPASLLALDTPPPAVRAVSPQTAALVLGHMERVVLPGGTGTKAAVPGYRVAGKTGTAWKYAPGGYSEDEYLSIFAGLVPASAPQLAAVVVIDEPTGKDYYGGDVAAPVFASVMAEALRLLAVPPDAAIAPSDTLQAATP